jgi:ubiquinone/menaquinone biosynthesis C-methylase UbiE
VLADAHALPFRDNYADIIVSRGSFHFWKEKEQAFREIYRVLKPGAAAYIGRGFSPNLPVETARKIRSERGGKMKYDVDKTADELRGIMNALGIAEYTIHRPKAPGGEDVNYGVWVEFHKK